MQQSSEVWGVEACEKGLPHCGDEQQQKQLEQQQKQLEQQQKQLEQQLVEASCTLQPWGLLGHCQVGLEAAACEKFGSGYAPRPAKRGGGSKKKGTGAGGEEQAGLGVQQAQLPVLQALDGLGGLSLGEYLAASAVKSAQRKQRLAAASLRFAAGPQMPSPISVPWSLGRE